MVLRFFWLAPNGCLLVGWLVGLRLYGRNTRTDQDESGATEPCSQLPEAPGGLGAMAMARDTRRHSLTSDCQIWRPRRTYFSSRDPLMLKILVFFWPEGNGGRGNPNWAKPLYSIWPGPWRQEPWMTTEVRCPPLGLGFLEEIEEGTMLGNLWSVEIA